MLIKRLSERVNRVHKGVRLLPQVLPLRLWLLASDLVSEHKHIKELGSIVLELISSEKAHGKEKWRDKQAQECPQVVTLHGATLEDEGYQSKKGVSRLLPVRLEGVLTQG